MINKHRGRFVIVILDGFGVGEMPDVEKVRPADIGANTCLHIFEKTPGLYLPALQELGLVNIMGFLPGKMRPSQSAKFGKAMLKHFGADTFFGHQEIMGTFPREVRCEMFCEIIDDAESVLLKNGYSVRRFAAGGNELLIVDDCVTVADNIECDPGQAINVTAAIDDIDFKKVLEIGELVRSVTIAPRVIAFGGRSVHLPDLLGAVEVHGSLIGVNAPASGVYNKDYHCIHMGDGVDAKVQAPTILGRAGLPVFLLGKVADVVSNEFGVSIPMVDTKAVLHETATLINENPFGFFCVNVQETDLCGHRENISEYVKTLEAADRGVSEIMGAIGENDILIVMADHGNDPTIGHPHHTREMVPLMIRSSPEGLVNIGIRNSLADVAATACSFFGASPPESGESFLDLII